MIPGLLVGFSLISGTHRRGWEKGRKLCSKQAQGGSFLRAFFSQDIPPSKVSFLWEFFSSKVLSFVGTFYPPLLSFFFSSSFLSVSMTHLAQQGSQQEVVPLLPCATSFKQSPKEDCLSCICLSLQS